VVAGFFAALAVRFVGDRPCSVSSLPILGKGKQFPRVM